MNSLEGKVIIVTGASRGIGAATALACTAAGAHVIPHATGMSDAAATLSGKLGVDFLYADFSEKNAGARLFDMAVKRAGRIDGVVNNAGVYLSSSVDGDGWEEGWSRTLAINVRAPADICRAAIDHFRTHQSEGSVVNIASRAGHRGDGPQYAAYAASKGAVIAMTKTWARAHAGEGIHFYAIAPGWVETRMAPEDIEKRAQAVADIPLGRVAQPEEVAEMAVFLLSGACTSATGATFDINGASYVR
ncbi:MAG: SDR family oxidoreductase [Pseudomonadota bacterium]